MKSSTAYRTTPEEREMPGVNGSYDLINGMIEFVPRSLHSNMGGLVQGLWVSVSVQAKGQLSCNLLAGATLEWGIESGDHYRIFFDKEEQRVVLVKDPEGAFWGVAQTAAKINLSLRGVCSVLRHLGVTKKCRIPVSVDGDALVLNLKAAVFDFKKNVARNRGVR